MADILKQTLRAASGVSFALDVLQPTCLAVQGTVAEMKDGNDATGSLLRGINEGDPASGAYREEWTLDAATVTDPISFVRAITRVKKVDSSALLVGLAEYQPSINGTPRGVEHAVEAVANDAQDFAADPADGQPWTIAKINAQKWGWRLRVHFGIPTFFDDVVDCMAVDFKLEIWSPEPIADLPAIDLIEQLADLRPTDTLSSPDIQLTETVGDIQFADTVGDVPITDTLKRDTSADDTIVGGT